MRLAGKKWARLSSILEWEGGNTCTYGTFFKVVLKATFLFRSKTWVMNLSIGRTLGGLHHREALCLAVMKLRRDVTGR